MKPTHFLLIATAVVAGGLWLFPSHDTYGYMQAQNFASEWIETRSPTYASGGTNLKLLEGRNAGAVDCHLCYEFTYSFNTNTPHRMTLSFRRGELVSAVVDGVKDELSLAHVAN